MKIITKITLTLIISLVMAQEVTGSQAFQNKANENKGLIATTHHTSPVGSIITTIASWEQFKAMNPKTYMNYLPCDGRKVPEGNLYHLVSDRTPDLRGLFVRGVNDMGPGNEIPELDSERKNPEDTKASEFQKQDWKSLYVSSQEAEPGYYTHQPVLVPKVGINKNSRSTNIFSGHWMGNNATVSKYRWDDVSETRPKNLSVYYYIKIN